MSTKISNMEQLNSAITFGDIRKKFPHLEGYANDFLITDSIQGIFNNGHFILKYPMRIDGIVIVLCKSGKGWVEINLKRYKVKENDIFICAPNDLIQATVPQGEHNIQAIMISTSFLKEIYISMNTFLPYYMSVKENPVFSLTNEEIAKLNLCFQYIKKEIHEEGKYHTEILRNLVSIYLYKLGNILYAKTPELQSEEPHQFKREEVLFNDFIKLVKEYHCKERRVDFYASKLYLSSKHFSSVIKRFSGKTASKWIDDYVILEAKTLLRYSTMSIQEVAYYLNFSNASFFGKYFKHHTGISPSEYKSD